MKRWTLSVTAAIVMTSALSGAALANTRHAAAPVTITFYEAMPGHLGSTLTTLTNEFEKSHPNITVQLIYTGSYSTQQQKLVASLAANQPPTIAQVEETWTTEFNQNGRLIPMQSVLPASTIKDIFPSLRADNSYGGKLVTAPFNRSAYVLFYNTDDFKAAGISQPPRIWAELQADASKLHRDGHYGFGMQANYYTFEMFLHQAGGSDLTANDKKAAFDSPAGMKALNFMYDLAVKDKSALVISENAYLSDGFNTNEYAMDIDTTAAMSFIDNPSTHWRVAPLPVGARMAVPTGGTNIALFKDATPAQQQAAGEYINFLISDPATVAWAKQTGYLPVRMSALHSHAWMAYIGANPTKAVAPAELQYAFFSPRLAALNSGMTSVTTDVGDCLSGSLSVAQTLSKSAQEINQALSSQ